LFEKLSAVRIPCSQPRRSNDCKLLLHAESEACSCADFLHVDFLEAGVSQLAKSGDSAQNPLLRVNERYGDISTVDETPEHH
jgi:hypothetical protein